MKTAVFWAVQQNTTLEWGPQNYLHCFWISFKVILKWVYDGFCPNFFIPENNIFLSKICGAAQQKLFSRLYGLYERGLVECLLQSSSISPFIKDVQRNPRLVISTDEHILVPESKFDIELFREIIRDSYAQSTSDLRLCLRALRIVENLLVDSYPSQYQVAMLQKITTTILQNTAFILHNLQTDRHVAHKKVYVPERSICLMLKLAAKFGFVSDMLHLAMYYYKTFRYKEALFVIEVIHSRKYIDGEALVGKSYSKKLTRTVIGIVPLENEICYLNELTPEQRSSSENGKSLLHIPPFVLLHLLEVLCYRLVEPAKVQAAIGNLHDLVTNDQGVFIPKHVRDISWEILGICQQTTGDHKAALHSFQQSLEEKPFNKIQTATKTRIRKTYLEIYRR
uniref:Mab-21-like HhH/H2TH-like domain-containing protein n=1 Tax=Magallana gigas TaxID=29159 RepID=K1Q566_MAGGI